MESYLCPSWLLYLAPENRSYPRSSTVFPFIFYRSANRIAPFRSVLGGNLGNVKVEGLVWPSSACSTEMKIHMSLVKVPSFLLPELQSEVVGMSQIMKRISPFFFLFSLRALWFYIPA